MLIDRCDPPQHWPPYWARSYFRSNDSIAKSLLGIRKMCRFFFKIDQEQKNAIWSVASFYHSKKSLHDSRTRWTYTDLGRCFIHQKHSYKKSRDYLVTSLAWSWSLDLIIGQSTANWLIKVSSVHATTLVRQILDDLDFSKISSGLACLRAGGAINDDFKKNDLLLSNRIIAT